MDATVTMADVARLAGVQRPVVSMWRKRPPVSGQAAVFPQPVARVAGVERFDLAEVTDYLTASGRGNNDAAALDGPAFAVPGESSIEDLIVLLCLRHLAGVDLEGQTLSTLTSVVDPTDELLADEVGLIVDPPTGYIDGLYDAAMGPADALDRLMHTSAGRKERRDVLTERGLDVVAPIVAELMIHLGEGTHVVDAGGGESAVPLQLATAAGHSVSIVGATPHGRAARRIAVLRGADRGLPLGARSLRIDGVAGENTADAVERLGALTMDLGPQDFGLVVGPAAVLTDGLGDRVLQAERDSHLRLGYVRAVVRLPRGLRRSAPRQAQALWLVSSSIDTTSPVALADLGDVRAEDLAARDLAMDVVAVAARRRGHHFRYLVSRSIDAAVAGQAIVARGLRAPAPLPTAPRTAAADLVEWVARVAAPMPTLRVVEARATTYDLSTVTLSQLRARGELRVHSGSRLDVAWSMPLGTVEAADIEGWSGVRFDPLDLEATAPHVPRTEPGDVIFTTSPPRAYVDETGGRVVPTPGRWIRLNKSSPLGPHAMAAQINSFPESARDIAAWSFVVVRDPELEPRLAELSALRRDLEGRVSHLHDITRLVATGHTPGLSVSTQPHHQEQ